MKDDPAAAAKLADRGNVLNHPDFVVDVHDRDQNGVRPQRRLELFEVEQTIGLDVEISDIESVALELAHGVECRLVLGSDRQQVLALVFVEMCRALQGEVDRFGGARGPDDFLRVAVDQYRDLCARLFDRVLRFPPE